MGSRNQPTLMLGDLHLSTNYVLLIEAVNALEPQPIEIRYTRTKNTSHMNIFFEYLSYNDARIVRRKLHDQKVGEITLNLDFTSQDSEVALFVSFTNTNLTIFDIEKTFDKYPSVLGAASYIAKENNNNNWYGCQTFFLRFLDLDEAIEAIMETRSVYKYDKLIFASLSTRNIDHAIQHVYDRETRKLQQQGVPLFHNFYQKRRVKMEELNAITVGQEFEFQQDLESSRWSHLPYSERTYDRNYDKSLMYDFYRNL